MPFSELQSLMVILTIAALAPLIGEWIPRVRLPLVVLEITLGILVGPQVLGFAEAGPTIQILATFGLASLFFLAGFEIDFPAIRGEPLRLATIGWLASLAVCLVVGFGLQGSGLADSGLLVGAALSTTALGTLIPILRDAKELPTRFGAYAVAAGAIGEFGPILLIATALSSGEGEHSGSWMYLPLFAVIVVGGAIVALNYRPPRLIYVLQEKMHTSAQLPMRLALLVLAGLIILTRNFGIDAILGALAAGVLVSLASPGHHGEALRHKLEGMGFGFFIPIFFVTTGLRFDLEALVSSPTAMLQVPMFLVLFFVVRGLPALLLRGELDIRSRIALGLVSATQLPLVVAITEIGVRSGRVRHETAASLVGAGMVSVLLFPLAALAIRRTAAPRTTSDATDRVKSADHSSESGAAAGSPP